MGKFSLNDIFVGKIFALKIFCRVDVLWKYFNTKILQRKFLIAKISRFTVDGNDAKATIFLYNPDIYPYLNSKQVAKLAHNFVGF